MRFDAAFVVPIGEGHLDGRCKQCRRVIVGLPRLPMSAGDRIDSHVNQTSAVRKTTTVRLTR